ncbi:MAG: hemerythrin domain-containing protein [Burkholderiaceae bacterium]|nr:hemerythrin domain-containing protein [Burkholderiaceae bacterium]
MGFFAKLFDDKGREKKPPGTGQPPAQGWRATVPQSLPVAARRRASAVQIPYNAHLVAQLDIEHQRLLALYTDISQSFAKGDVTRAATGLRKFTSDIQAHLLTEDIGLYVYLEDVLADNGGKKSRATVRDIHHAMAAIGQAVMGFLNKYRLLDKKPELRATFGGDLAGIGAALVERIKLEETTLYSLYQSSAPAG